MIGTSKIIIGTVGGGRYTVTAPIVKEDYGLYLKIVPCYRKSDGEIGMYDTVSKTFYTNAGTGTFSKGADV